MPGTDHSVSGFFIVSENRRAALARFAELKKQYPGIVAEMDIEKKSWEK